MNCPKCGHVFGVSVENWMKAVTSNPAYEGLDTANEYRKAEVWCAANGRRLTLKFFVNWLNKADRPIPAAPKPERLEPPVRRTGTSRGWKDIRTELLRTNFLDGGLRRAVRLAIKSGTPDGNPAAEGITTPEGESDIRGTESQAQGTDDQN